MNTWMIIGIAFGVLFAFLIYEIARRKRRVATAAQSPATKPQLAVVDVYRGLRQMALTGSRVEIGLPEPTSPTTPWRVVMDWGLESGALTTVVAVSDGSASIYYGSGGGAIGGIGHESVRLAAIKTVKIAGELKP